MTQGILKPDLSSEVGKMKQRITDLERALRRQRNDAVGIVVPFNQTGPLSAGTSSDEFTHPTGATLLYCCATLKVIGLSDTVVSMRCNDVEFDSFSFPAGAKLVVPGANKIFRAQLDVLSFGTPTVGSGAEGLVVQAVFGL